MVPHVGVFADAVLAPQWLTWLLKGYNMWSFLAFMFIMLVVVPVALRWLMEGMHPLHAENTVVLIGGSAFAAGYMFVIIAVNHTSMYQQGQVGSLMHMVLLAVSVILVFFFVLWVTRSEWAIVFSPVIIYYMVMGWLMTYGLLLATASFVAFGERRDWLGMIIGLFVLVLFVSLAIGCRQMNVPIGLEDGWFWQRRREGLTWFRKERETTVVNDADDADDDDDDLLIPVPSPVPAPAPAPRPAPVQHDATGPRAPLWPDYPDDDWDDDRPNDPFDWRNSPTTVGPTAIPAAPPAPQQAPAPAPAAGPRRARSTRGGPRANSQQQPRHSGGDDSDAPVVLDAEAMLRHMRGD